MRAREFLPEDTRKFSARKSAAMVSTYTFPDMPSSNPYLAYRFGLAMANHEIRDNTGPTDNFAVISAYTDGEDEIIQAAVEKTGKRAVRVADAGSREPDSTNTQSPVAQAKKNRYGI